MRLGLVIYGSLDTLSGGYLYDRKLVEYLRGQGDIVEIFSQPWRSYARHLIQNFDQGFTRQLAELRVDALLQDELNHPSLFWLNRWLKLRIRYPIVSIVHHLRSSEQHPRPWKLLYRLVERAYLRGVDGFIYNSQTTSAAVEALRGSSAPGVVATPGGDQFENSYSQLLPGSGERAESATTRSQGLSILFLGNLIPRKGLHTLLTSLAMLPRDGWRLEIVGQTGVDPVYARKVQALAAPLGERVTFHGRLGAADLQSLWQSCNLLVVPSTYEGFGIVYLEGMSFGLPAIAGTAGAAGEIIADGVNGFLVPSDAPPVLADRLSRLLSDPTLLATMRQNARQRFAQFPTWAESMQKIREFLVSFTGAA